MTDRRPRWATPAALVGVTAISRLAFYLAGVRFDAGVLRGQGDDFQLLDLHQLQHNLVQSIWYLHSQPPLFNLFTGLLLQLPRGSVVPVLVLLSLVLSLGMVLSFYYLCLELHISEIVAFLLSILVILDPANVLYENWYFYAFPTAVLMTFGALSIARFVRTRSAGWGVGCFGSLAGVVLLNSTFQWFWFVLVAGPIAYVMRNQWRKVLAVIAIPLLVMGIWYVKDVAIFGTTTTSSWLGMNVVSPASNGTPNERRALLAKRKIAPLSKVFPFSPLSAYGPKYRHARTGVAVLDAPLKSNGSPNFNNIAFIRVSDQYLHDDLVFIESYPSTYARTVGRATVLFFVPSSQYYFIGSNADHIAPYLHFYDAVVGWQADRTDFTSNPFAEGNPSLSEVSLSALILVAVTIVGVPVLLWRRREDPIFSVTLGFIWISTLYVLSGVLIHFGDNQRFRYDLGQLPLAAAAAVATAFLRRRGSIDQ